MVLNYLRWRTCFLKINVEMIIRSWYVSQLFLFWLKSACSVTKTLFYQCPQLRQRSMPSNAKCTEAMRRKVLSPDSPAIITVFQCSMSVLLLIKTPVIFTCAFKMICKVESRGIKLYKIYALLLTEFYF